MVWEIKFRTKERTINGQRVEETLVVAEFESLTPTLKEVVLGPQTPLHYKALSDDLDCAACGRVIWRKRMIWTDRERFHESHEYRCTVWGSGL
jgi:hypothetical protein